MSDSAGDDEATQSYPERVDGTLKAGVRARNWLRDRPSFRLRRIFRTDAAAMINHLGKRATDCLALVVLVG